MTQIHFFIWIDVSYQYLQFNQHTDIYINNGNCYRIKTITKYDKCCCLKQTKSVNTVILSTQYEQILHTFALPLLRFFRMRKTVQVHEDSRCNRVQLQRAEYTKDSQEQQRQQTSVSHRVCILSAESHFTRCNTLS